MQMTKDELMEVIKDNIKEYLPEHIANSCEVQIVEVAKINDRVLKGFVFDRGENMPCPTFYIEDAYEDYLRGDTPQEIMEDLANAVEQSWDMKLPVIDMDLDYEKIKDHLGYQLVDSEHNRERLGSCIHTRMGNDLAMIYYIENEHEDGFSRAVITNEMAESMGYDEEQLKKDAKVSMEKLHPPLLFSGREMAKKGPNYEIDNLLDYHDMVLDDRTYILTNEENRYGASSIMYDGLQEKLGNMVQGNYYVIPNNAIEEVENVCEEHKLIYLMMDDESIRVKNRIAENRDVTEVQKVSNMGYSTKGNGRGYGLANIKSICKHHHIKYQIKIEETNVSKSSDIIEILKTLPVASQFLT